CVGDRRALDEILLGLFGTKIAAGLQALGADDREGDVMLDAGGHFGRREVPAGGLKELHRGPVFERRRGGHVDDDLGTRKRRRQALRLCLCPFFFWRWVWRGGHCPLSFFFSSPPRPPPGGGRPRR